MSKVVNGFTGIIAPPNLSTNGSFLIHQRDEVNSTLYSRVVGDYVCDAWKLTNIDVDYLQTAHHTNGWVRFNGHGKSGDIIIIENKNEIGGHGSVHANTVYSEPRTATVSALSIQGHVGISVRAVPSYSISNNNVLHNPNNVIAGTWTSQPKTESVFQSEPWIIESELTSTIKSGTVEIRIDEDGLFDVYLYRYGEFAGAYRHPPIYAPVNYADDLMRCQRYYQKGDIPVLHQGAFTEYDATGVESYHMLNLPIQMESTPSYALYNRGLYTWDGTSTVIDHINVSSIDILGNGPKGCQIRSFTTDPTAKGHFLVSGARTEYTWTAEVV